MSHTPRTRRVTNTAERFILYFGPPKYYVFRNLGPSDSTLTFWANPATQEPQTIPLRVGDYAELFCAVAETKLAGTATDPSIIEWTPVD